MISKKATFFLLYCFCNLAYGLVPIESLVLGDFSRDFKAQENDPIAYIFSQDRSNKGSSSDKETLAIYKGFYDEGVNLKNFCTRAERITYPSNWKEDQAKRTYLSTFQYLSLDLSVRALVKYARYFEFTKEEFSNFTESLVGNSCSQNTTVISLKELKKNFLVRFEKDEYFSCLLYTSPSPRDATLSRMPSSA